MKSSKKDFIAEAEELIEEAERLLIEIQDTFENGVNPDTINALFRSIHTMKGLSGLFGYKGLSEFSHSFESILDDLRLGRIELNESAVRFLFKNMDILKAVIKKISTEGVEDLDVESLARDIEGFRQSAMSGSTKKGEDILSRIDESILKVLSEYEEHRLKTNIKDGKGIYLAKAVFKLIDLDKSLNELTGLLKNNGELISTLPTSTDIPPDSIGFNLLFASQKEREELEKTVNLPIDELIEKKRESIPVQQIQQKPVMETSLKSTSTYVRVDIEKLDRILNTISELNLARAATNRIAREMSEVMGNTPLVIDVFKISQTFGRRLSELQNQVLEIRMIPIGQIFSRLGQVIRRYSREMGKQIELVLYGEDTEIDKHLAEEIVDPLMHIVRNAIDHGIELPDERKKAGKKETGIITLKAFQRGNHVVIEVSDDGSGIDIERVKKKAIEKGLITHETGNLSDKEILDFIFLPGFSTKTSVSEVSGRGVGMDVVKEKITTLGGFVDIDTEMGKGTTFILTTPITLAILKALIVRVGKERFSIPLTSISETLVIEHKDLQTIEGKKVYNLRGEMLPVEGIDQVFGINRDDSDRSFAIVAGFGSRKMGFLVDEVMGQQEIVIKSLGEYFRGLKGFAGAAEIGKHEVILVIDVESIIEENILKQRNIVRV
ncbi:MAG: chemotaxis protein CheA [Thermodesulfovibrionales bacterium]